jgi:hypothetical protein
MTYPLFRFRTWSALAVACSLLVLPSMASAADGGDEVGLVKERAERMWSSKVQDQWETVFELLPPEEQEIGVDKDTYAKYQRDKGWFKFEAAKVNEVVVDKDFAWVDVSFTTSLRQYPTMPKTETRMWEFWLKRADWRPVPHESASQFPLKPPTLRDAASEAALLQRIEQQWKAFEALDWPAIYDMADPKYRSVVSREEFLKRRTRYVYLSHKVEWVEAYGNAARAKVSYRQKLNDPTLHKLLPTDESNFEGWVKVDGEWFRQMQIPKTDNKPQAESK